MKPATINAGFGIQRYTNSGQTLRGDDRAPRPHRERREARARGGSSPTSGRHVFHPVKDPLAFYPPETAGRGLPRLDLDRPPRPAHARDMRPAAAHGLGRARQPDPAEPGDADRAAGLPRPRVPRGRRRVPDRHRARGRPRPAGEVDVRADGRDRRLLARLPAAQAEGDRAAGRGEARVGGVPAPGRAPRLSARGDGARAARPVRRRGRGVPRGEAAGRGPVAHARAPARGAGARPGRSRRGLRRPPLPDAVREDRASLGGGRAPLGGRPPAGLDGAGRVGAAAAPATRSTSSRRTRRTASTRSSATCPRSAPSTRSPSSASRPGDAARRGLRSGDRARVFNDRGRARRCGRASTTACAPAVVVVPTAGGSPRAAR